MAEVRAHFRLRPGGAFVYVRGYRRHLPKQIAESSINSDGFGMLSVLNRKTMGLRSFFIGDPRVAAELAQQINAEKIKVPEEIFH